MDTSNAIRLGKIRGIPIKAEWSLVIIFGLLTWSLATTALPDLAGGYTDAQYWVAAAFTAVAFLLSLLAHELSHSVVASNRGIPVRDITLWFLGGVSRIEQEADNPNDDLRIAIAGPLASVAVAVVSFVAAYVFAVAGVSDILVACLLWLAYINIILAVFNLIPAAPLDGGRVLRAILWKRRGDRISAAVSATKAGRVFGYILVGLGFAEIVFAETFSGFWLVLLGWFLLSASRAEEAQIWLARDLNGVRVRDVMTPDPITIPEDTMAEVVLHDYVLGCHCSSFPVVDPTGQVTGLVTLRKIRQLDPTARLTTRIGEIATPIVDVPRATPDDPLLDVLRRTAGEGDGRILVFDGQHLVGIVTPSDVTRAASRGRERASSPISA